MSQKHMQILIYEVKQFVTEIYLSELVEYFHCLEPKICIQRW